jgi:assimilatory nitrate reductase catalytic subunit
VSRAPGRALADFHIFRLVAEYWGCGAMFRRWTSPEAVFGVLQEISRGQPCDISGIGGYEMIVERGGVQWPFPEGGGRRPVAGGDDGVNERRLFEDGKFYTPDGRARFVFEKPREVPEPVDAEFPLVLLTGRGSSAQWHTESRTAKSAILRKLHPAALCVEIHPLDAQRRRIRNGDAVQVTSRRASITAEARVTAAVQCGQAFLPMHDPSVNQLTLAAFDPVSRQPSYKHCAVDVRRL